MKNTLKIEFLLEEKELTLSVESYAANGQIAILLCDAKDGEYFSDLSVYIMPFPEKTYMAVDTNNFPGWETLIKNYKLWEFKQDIPNWFCLYPVYAMNLEELAKRDSYWVAKFLSGSDPEE